MKATQCKQKMLRVASSCVCISEVYIENILKLTRQWKEICLFPGGRETTCLRVSTHGEGAAHIVNDFLVAK
jgi:hypothetical protein